MAFPQSKFAYTSLTNPSVWFTCDRCGFRKNRSEARWQFDYRGLSLANLRLLVCQICNDDPQPQLKPILVGPDPVPVMDPRPGFAATQMGFTVAIPPYELLDDDGQGPNPNPVVPIGIYNQTTFNGSLYGSLPVGTYGQSTYGGAQYG